VTSNSNRLITVAVLNGSRSPGFFPKPSNKVSASNAQNPQDDSMLLAVLKVFSVLSFELSCWLDMQLLTGPIVSKRRVMQTFAFSVWQGGFPFCTSFLSFSTWLGGSPNCGIECVTPRFTDFSFLAPLGVDLAPCHNSASILGFLHLLQYIAY